MSRKFGCGSREVGPRVRRVLGFPRFAGFRPDSRVLRSGFAGFEVFAVECVGGFVLRFFCRVLYALEGRLCVRVCVLKYGGSQRKVRVPTTCFGYLLKNVINVDFKFVSLVKTCMYYMSGL